ncbi:MAG: DNA polymerase III subunit gamma/tau [Nitrospiraceae bacterium]|nr:MAG: DNA polymerase III subunit gamma/tau [Nitrospiraceae bacterium]
MSYIVLARKWRPQGFEDLIGQETVVRTFHNAISSGKIVHAYLFSGPRGVGKTSSARILAKALNCERRTGSGPCGSCPSCRAITDGASVDVFEIDGASNNSVDAVRELRETVKYAPSGGKYKIYIIDEVHMLSTSAFNALLKTLEEPPEHVIFIFATTEPKKIPSTILSRCQHHAFRRISKTRIKEQLKEITTKEKIEIKDKALDMISKAADGSMRDALTLLDQAYSFSDTISEQELQILLGLPEIEIIHNLSKTILNGNIAETLSIIKELTDRGSDLRQLTKELVEHFRNIAIVKVSDDAGGLLEYSEDEVEKFNQYASGVSIEQLTLLLSELLRLESEVRNAINPRYTLELGLLKTSFIKGMTSIEDIVSMISGRERIHPVPDRENNHPDIASDPSKKKIAAADEAADSAKDHNLDKGETWKRLIHNIDADDHLLACKLAEAKVIDINESELSIGFNGGMSVLADSIEKNSNIIKEKLREISGRNLKLKISSLPGHKNVPEIHQIKEEVFAEPIVQDAMKIFSSSLIRVKSLREQKKDD